MASETNGHESSQAAQSVAIVVDGAIELPSERLKELNIFVVPRVVKAERKTIDLKRDYPAPALVANLQKPRPIRWLPLVSDSFQAVYQEALEQYPAVLSLHYWAEIDKAIVTAHFVRNLLWPADIYVTEVPLLGSAYARYVEVLATLAQSGWTRAELLAFGERLQRVMRSDMIVPFPALRPFQKLIHAQKQPPQMNSAAGRMGVSLRRQPVLLTLVGNDKPYFQMLDTQKSVPDLAAGLATQTESLFEMGGSPQILWWQLGYEKIASELAQAMSAAGLDHAVDPQWSPLLFGRLGRKMFGLSVTPPWEEMIQQATRTKQAIVAARRFEKRVPFHNGQQQKRRLSEYRVHL